MEFEEVTSLDFLPEITELARISHAESRFSYITFSESKVKKILSDAVSNRIRYGVFIARLNGTAVGFASCSVGEYHIGEGTLLVTIHNINVLANVRRTLNGGRAARGLMEGISTWAHARGAAEILLHVTAGAELDRAHKFAKHGGYTLIGGSYAAQVRT